jgi:alkylresorcinol/alkylpyrone synthase
MAKMQTHSGISSLSTAVPRHRLNQGDAAAIADALFSDRIENYEGLKPIFVNAGIDQRRISMPIDWYMQPRNWQERMDVYLDVATKLFRETARQALDQAGLRASDIDAIVTVSSTGIATPTLEAHVSGELGFRPDILRVPVFGLGCAGGVSGLSIAERIARSMPGSHVLLVVVELCSLAFQMDKSTKANVVATALFGDGAAAAIISSGPAEPGIKLGTGCQHTWPDTLQIMGWKVDPNGFEVIFDRAIPPFARRHLRPAVDAFLDRLEIDRDDIARLSFHPGGTKVIQAIEAAFELQDGTLDIERRVLRSYGNMSAPTVLFVLRQALDDGHRGLSLLTALGPGFTAASVPVTVQ